MEDHCWGGEKVLTPCPLLEEWRYLNWFRLADFTFRWVPGFLTVLHEDYENILCSYKYMTNPRYTERIKIVCEDRRTVEFCSKFAWISFIAFGEFLIHVNKFRDYKNSYLRSSLNTQQTCGGNLPKFPYTYICCSSMLNSVSLYTRIFIFMQCIVPYPASWIFTSVLCALCPV
jgi:hypothetical protein